jgi:hypothetical protein
VAEIFYPLGFRVPLSFRFSFKHSKSQKNSFLVRQ